MLTLFLIIWVYSDPIQRNEWGQLSTSTQFLGLLTLLAADTLNAITFYYLTQFLVEVFL